MIVFAEEQKIIRYLLLLRRMAAVLDFYPNDVLKELQLIIPRFFVGFCSQIDKFCFYSVQGSSFLRFVIGVALGNIVGNIEVEDLIIRNNKKIPGHGIVTGIEMAFKISYIRLIGVQIVFQSPAINIVQVKPVQSVVFRQVIIFQDTAVDHGTFAGIDHHIDLDKKDAWSSGISLEKPSPLNR